MAQDVKMLSKPRNRVNKC